MMQDELLALVRPEILALQAYRSARSEQTSGKIWLDANESPWNDATLYNRYPEPQPQTLVTALAKLYQVQPQQLLVTRGSDEGIDLLIRTFCRAYQDQIMLCPPTYGMYTVAANLQGATIVTVPLRQEKNFVLDLPRMLASKTEKVKLIFLCSPNNPTGNSLAAADILALCHAWAKEAFVIVDEAYIEFAEEESLTAALATQPNLIILRTLSKAYGLAGIRCGATLAHPTVINILKKVIAPYPIAQPIISIVTSRLAVNLTDKIAQLRQERQNLAAFLQGLPWVKKVWPSQANFLLFAVDDSKKRLTHCQAHGIVLRDRSHEYGLENCLRVTVGLPQENALLMEVLQNA